MASGGVWRVTGTGHVMLLLIVGAHAFQWTSDIQNGGKLRRCVGDNVTFPWSYVTESEENVIVQFWFSNKSGSFASFFADNFMTSWDRVTQAGAAGVTLYDVSTADDDMYGVSVMLYDGQEPLTQHIDLTVVEPPRTTDGHLHVIEHTQNSTGARNTSRPHKRLKCGEFLSLGSPHVSVFWTDPSGHRLPSISFLDGYFHLELDPHAKGGNYTCSVQREAEATQCLASDSPLLTAAGYHLVTMETRMLDQGEALRQLERTVEKLSQQVVLSHVTHTNTSGALWDIVTALDQEQTNRTEALEGQVAELHNTETELLQVFVEQNNTIFSLGSQVAGLHKQKTDQNTQVSSLQSQVADLEKQNTDQNTQVSSLQSQVADLQKQNTDQNIQVASLQSQVTDLEKQNTDQNTKVSSLQSQVADLQKQNANQNTQISGLQKQVSDQNTQISGFQSQLSNLKNIVLGLSQNTQLSSLQAENADLKNNITDLQKQISDQNTHISGLQKQNTDLNTQISNLQKDNVDQITQISGLQKQNTDLNTQMSSLQTENANQTTQISGLKKDNADQNTQISRLQSDLQRVNTDLKKADQDINQQLDNLGQNLTLVTSQLMTKTDRLKVSQDSLQTNVTFLQGDVKLGGTTLTTLQAEFGRISTLTAPLLRKAGFYVYLAAPNVTANTPIVFKLGSHVGGGYDASSGKYTAPFSGWYTLQAQLFPHRDSDTNVWFDIMHNSGAKARAGCYQKAEGTFTCTTSISIYVAAGDKLWVQPHVGGRYWTSHWDNFFTGVLVIPD